MRDDAVGQTSHVNVLMDAVGPPSTSVVATQSDVPAAVDEHAQHDSADYTLRLPDELMEAVLLLAPMRDLCLGVVSSVCRRWAALVRGRRLQSAIRDGRWEAYEAGKVNPISLGTMFEHQEHASGEKVSQMTRRIQLGRDGTIFRIDLTPCVDVFRTVWDVPEREHAKAPTRARRRLLRAACVKCNSNLLSLAIANDGEPRLLFAGGVDGTITCMDISADDRPIVISIMRNKADDDAGVSHGVTTLACTKDGRTLVSGSCVLTSAVRVLVWDVASEGVVRTLALDDSQAARYGHVVSVALCPHSGEQLYAGLNSGAIVYWDDKGGGSARVSKVHNDAITGVVAGPAGDVFSCSADGQVCHTLFKDADEPAVCVLLTRDDVAKRLEEMISNEDIFVDKLIRFIALGDDGLLYTSLCGYSVRITSPNSMRRDQFLIVCSTSDDEVAPIKFVTDVQGQCFSTPMCCSYDDQYISALEVDARGSVYCASDILTIF